MWIILILLAAWFYWGDLGTILANKFWENEAAPWEKVTALYFPDNNDESNYLIFENLSSVKSCQMIAHTQAEIRGDPLMIKGSYICEIGKEREENGITIYRTNVK